MHPAYQMLRMSPPLTAAQRQEKESRPMVKPFKVAQAKRFTRDDVETALVILEESTAGGKFIDALDAAAALAGCQRILKREAEAACNGFADYRGNWSDALEKASEARADRAAKKVAAILAPYGITASTQGDPRGAVLYLKTPKSERANSWGGKESGWAVT